MSYGWAKDAEATAYTRGYRQALSDAGKCGAHNEDTPGARPWYAACMRQADHTGMHDDGWRVWGDPLATQEEVMHDAAAERDRWLLDGHIAVTDPSDAPDIAP